jgi:hypothetical protein
MADTVSADAVKRKLKFDYMKIKNEPLSRDIEVLSKLLAHFQRQQIVIRDLIQDAANQIQSQYRLRWSMIGLLSESDGMYRYEVHSGMRPEAWHKQRAKVYKYEDFEPNAHNYKAGEISRLSRVYLEEENQLVGADQQVANRPVLLMAKRRTEDETLEADFIDTLILGPSDALLGWIEYGGTLTSKFPDPSVIRYIEVISSVLAAAITVNSRTWKR